MIREKIVKKCQTAIEQFEKSLLPGSGEKDCRDDLALFFHIYNVFLMFLIIIFCAEFKSDEYQIEKFEHFLDSRLKVNLKVKFYFFKK